MESYGDDPEACRILQEYERRPEDPVRIALAGMAKAGKSTLLNAIVGEEIAPTDTRECTATVTWYRYGPASRVTVHTVAGQTRSGAVKRRDGRLVFDLGGQAEEDVDRVVVEWPADGLRNLTLIDTPASARSRRRRRPGLRTCCCRRTGPGRWTPSSTCCGTCVRQTWPLWARSRMVRTSAVRSVPWGAVPCG
ncbi:dynamin family protein [Arthrobacter sp. I2-34]|uniref:Dynamin family protein n=1 Tax=Arthrobacter hankyongi TaxID=2904801 RepID=A0ABS9LE80_9MICC|nr:dynamin family protein [Arthrobacter hankyongi]MCG2624960.1 dynamin family protein [Arthrobacter hankyongi]